MLSTQDELLTEQELSKKLKIKQRTLQHWRLTGNGPAILKLSDRTFRYKMSDVQAWLKKGGKLRTPK
jgi:predicted DNA-binding transcriptional regulator AlpA